MRLFRLKRLFLAVSLWFIVIIVYPYFSHVNLKGFDKNGVKLVIFTGYRCGSSFAGELFKQNDDFFYYFEPLQWVHFNMYGNGNADYEVSVNAGSNLKPLFDCHLVELIERSTQLFPDNEYKRKEWLRVWYKPKPADVEEDCMERGNIAMKVIRVPELRNLEELVTVAGVKIIYLVRDPRGTLLSQRTLGRSNEPGKDKPKDVNTWCQQMEENLKYLNTWCGEESGRDCKRYEQKST